MFNLASVMNPTLFLSVLLSFSSLLSGQLISPSHLALVLFKLHYLFLLTLSRIKGYKLLHFLTVCLGKI